MEELIGSSLFTNPGIEYRLLSLPYTVFNFRFVGYDIAERLILLSSIIDSAERDQTFPGIIGAGKTTPRWATMKSSCSQLTMR